MHPLRTSDGLSLYYQESGTADPPVVLVHGWMVSGRVWQKLTAQLSARRCIALDLRGAGASREVDHGFSLERMAQDVAELLETLDAGVDLVGHSMGGQLALLAARLTTKPPRSLALLNPVPPDGLPLPAPVREQFRSSGGNAAALGAILDVACKRLSADDRAALVADALQIHSDTISSVLDAWVDGGIAPRVQGLSCPTLVLATDDPFLPPDLLERTIVSRLPSAELGVLHGPGHYPQLEAPAETAERLQQFWSAVAS